MASSGTTVFSVTVSNFISSSLRSMRVNQEGQNANANQLTDGMLHLNMLLKRLTIPGVKLWTCYQVLVPVTANAQSYTIGPAPADVVALRPVSVSEYGNFLRQTVGGVPNDTPLRLISRMEYMQMGAKASVGVPNSIYYNPSIDLTVPGAPTGAAGHGILYVYVPAATGFSGTIYLNAQRAAFDITADTEELDIPTEYLSGFRYAFYASFGEDCEIPEDRLTRYIKMAQKFEDEFINAQVENASVTFGMDNTGNRK